MNENIDITDLTSSQRLTAPQVQCGRFVRPAHSDTSVHAIISPGGYSACNKLTRVYYNFNLRLPEINHADVYLSE